MYKFNSVCFVNCAIICKKEQLISYLVKNSQKIYIYTIYPKNLGTKKNFVKIYANGVLIEEKEFKSHLDKLRLSLPIILYAEFFLQFISHFVFRRRHADVFFGEGVIFSLFGILARYFNRINKIVYLSGDYFPNLKYFVLLDNFVAKRVNSIWNASNSMQILRKSQNKIETNMVVFPLGIESIQGTISKKKYTSKTDLVYMGNIQSQHGFDLLLEMLLANKNSRVLDDCTVQVIGKGIYFQELKSQIQKMNLAEKFRFHGFIQERDEVVEILSKCFAGLALYNPLLENFSSYSDSGKIKDYLSYYLPVITTNVPEIHKDISTYNLGYVIDFNHISLYEAIKQVQKNSNDSFYDKKIAEYIRNNTWEKIIESALRKCPFLFN